MWPTSSCTPWAAVATADFAERERSAATAFAHMAREEGIDARGVPGRPGRGPLGASPQPGRDRAGAGPRGAAPHLLPGRHGDRRGERVLPDAPVPGAAPAGDDRPVLAAQPHPADRGGGRARVPGPGGGAAGDGRPRGPDRRARRGDLRGAAERDGRRARPSPPPDGARAAAHAATVLPLDRAGHTGGRRRGPAADRGPGRRHRGGGSHRPPRSSTCSRCPWPRP